MINLYTTFYKEINPDRIRELEECIHKNINSQYIDRIVVLSETQIDSFLVYPKFSCVKIEKRPTFNLFFDTINLFTNNNDINIIANTDIFFDETILLVKKHLTHDQCFALTRWDALKNSKALFYHSDYSQDTWIFKGPIKKVNGNFLLGYLACDGKIAFELAKHYKLSNPSISVVTYHLHNSNVRNYNSNNKYDPPYKNILPSSFNLIPNLIPDNNNYKRLLEIKYFKLKFLRPLFKIVNAILRRFSKRSALVLSLKFRKYFLKF